MARMGGLNLVDRGKPKKVKWDLPDNIEQPIRKRKPKFNFDKVYVPVYEPDMGMTFKGKAFEGVL